MLANPHALVEGCIITCVRDPGQARVHLRPRRGAARASDASARRRRARPAPPGTSARTSSGSGFDLEHRRPRRRRRLHLRRGDRAARLPRGPPRPAPAQAAVPRRRRPVRLADGRQQRRDDRERALHRAQRRRLVPAVRHREVARASRCSRVSGHVDRPRHLRGAARHHDARAARVRRRDARRSASSSSGCPGGSSVPMLTAEHLDIPMTYEDMAAVGTMLGTGTPMVFDDTVSRGQGGHPLAGVLQARVLRQVHAVPRGHRTGSPARWRSSRTATAARARSTCSSTSAARSWAAPSAPSATRPPPRSRPP